MLDETAQLRLFDRACERQRVDEDLEQILAETNAPWRLELAR
jgi:hypothetical protein